MMLAPETRAIMSMTTLTSASRKLKVSRGGRESMMRVGLTSSIDSSALAAKASSARRAGSFSTMNSSTR